MVLKVTGLMCGLEEVPGLLCCLGGAWVTGVDVWVERVDMIAV